MRSHLGSPNVSLRPSVRGGKGQSLPVACRCLTEHRNCEVLEDCSASGLAACCGTPGKWTEVVGKSRMYCEESVMWIKNAVGAISVVPDSLCSTWLLLSYRSWRCSCFIVLSKKVCWSQGKISSLRLVCVFMLYGMFLFCKHPGGWLQHEGDTKVSAPYLRMCTFLATSLHWWCLGEGAVTVTCCSICSHLIWHVLGPFMLESACPSMCLQ